MSDAAPAGAGIEVEVPATLAGERADKAVSLITGVSRRVAAQLVDDGQVRVDGRAVRTRSQVLSAGQRLWVGDVPSDDDEPVADPSVAFGVVYEDDALVVVDKPPGLVVHGGAGIRGGTLVSGLLARYPELAELPRAGAGEPQRPGIVHRLDKGTSGLLVVARSVEAYRTLARQFRRHTAGRTYLTLVSGTVEAEEGVIEAPLGRSLRRPEQMTVTPRGRAASTGYQVRSRYRAPLALTLLQVTLNSGRTHQVRVHFAAIGHPVVGDDRYGGGAGRSAARHTAMAPGRLFLHAWRLDLEHPNGERRAWTSPLPDDLESVLARLTRASRA